MSDSKQSSCKQKIAYESEKEARAAIATLSYRHKNVRLKVYKCNDCGNFHVSSNYE